MKHFKESLNTAVFTSRFILDGSPILFIFHDEDGSWQFLGEEEIINENDMKLVALSEIIEIDNSVLNVADMPEGFEAIRSNKKGEWKVINSN